MRKRIVTPPAHAQIMAPLQSECPMLPGHGIELPPDATLACGDLQ
jgi:hypothetical protein